MKVDIIDEIKSLHKALVKTLFSMNKSTDHNRHPRPLQIAILEYLSEHQKDEVNQKDLEEHFKISKAAISDVLKAMEKNGLIERIVSEKDARKNIIIVTEKSKELHSNLINDLKKVNNELLECLTEEELKSFLAITDKLKKYMKEGF